MSTAGWFALIVTLGCLIALARFRNAPDMVMMAGLSLLLAGGVIPVEDAVAGFANPGMLTIAALFIVMAGLRETGIVARLGTAALGHPAGERRAMLRMFLPVAGASSVINNTPVVALFVPIILDWAQRHRYSASKLLMPLSFIAIAAGTCSLLGSATNVIANGLLDKATGTGLALFEPALLGLPLVAVSGAYLLIVAPRLLVPHRNAGDDDRSNGHPYVIEFTVTADGPLVGRSIGQAGLRHLRGVYLAEIGRAGHCITAVAPEEVLQPGDRLAFVGDADNIADVLNVRGLAATTDHLDVPRTERNLAEVVVAPRSALIGSTIREAGFRGRFGAVIVSVRRHGQLLRHTKLGDIELEAGDTLLVSSREPFTRFQGTGDFLLIRELSGYLPFRHKRARYALGIFALMIGTAVTGTLSLLVASWLAAGLMIGSRCLDVSKARASLNLSVLTVIAASIGVGAALELTGVAHALAGLLEPVIPATPAGAVLGIFVLTTVLSALITNSAAVVIVFPLALDLALRSGLGADAATMAVIAGASASFATPIAYQTNLMVQGPGHYGLGDFLKLGIPLTVIFGIVSVLLIPALYN